MRRTSSQIAVKVLAQMEVEILEPPAGSDGHQQFCQGKHARAIGDDVGNSILEFDTQLLVRALYVLEDDFPLTRFLFHFVLKRLSDGHVFWIGHD